MRDIQINDLSYLRWTDSTDTLVVTFGKLIKGSSTGPHQAPVLDPSWQPVENILLEGNLMTVLKADPGPQATDKRLESVGTWHRVLAAAVAASWAWLAVSALAQGAPKVRIITSSGDFLVDIRPVAAHPKGLQLPAAADLPAPTAILPAATLVSATPAPEPALALEPKLRLPTLSPAFEPAPAPAVAVAQPAETRLATVPLPASVGAARDDRQEVEAAVRAWTEAWAGKNMNAYLSSYGQNFEPPGKQTRKAWEEVRRARIVGKSRISVKLSKLAVSMQGSHAVATFRQDYSADALNISSLKTLNLAKAGERWVIVKESTGS